MLSAVNSEVDMEILTVSGLCKSYPGFTLDNIGLKLETGRIMGLIGRNGAGKSTTIKSILGIVHPDKGSLQLKGIDIGELSAEKRQSIAYSWGGADFYGKKKIKDILAVTRSFYSNWDKALEEKYLKLFNIDTNKCPAELSQGMRVKLSLVMALSHHGELLILDEPTSGLDPVSRDELLEIFAYLKRQGAAILFSTHITSDLDKCADDICYIREGKLIFSGSKDDLLQLARKENRGSDLEEIMLSYEREVYREKFVD